jgi:hypothetical protein
MVTPKKVKGIYHSFVSRVFYEPDFSKPDKIKEKLLYEKAFWKQLNVLSKSDPSMAILYIILGCPRKARFDRMGAYGLRLKNFHENSIDLE